MHTSIHINPPLAVAALAEERVLRERVEQQVDDMEADLSDAEAEVAEARVQAEAEKNERLNAQESPHDKC